MDKRKEIGDEPWFDPETGFLLLDERVQEAPEFRNILADGVVTDEELEAYGERVAVLLKELDQSLPWAMRQKVGEALTALAVLHALQARHVHQKEGGASGRF